MYSLQIATFVVVSLAIAYLMVFAGVNKRALEWKRPSRSCPVCGRHARSCRCRH